MSVRRGQSLSSLKCSAFLILLPLKRSLVTLRSLITLTLIVMPEEVTWMLEDQEDEVSEACYLTITDHYEFILCVMYPHRMRDFGFDASDKTFCHGDNEDDDKAFYHGDDDDDDDKAFYYGDDDDDDKTICHGDGSGNCLSKSSQLKLAVAQLCGAIEDII